MNPLRILELLAVIVAVMGSIFAAFLFLEERHLAAKEKFKLEASILEKDIKTQSETRYFYQDKKNRDGLTPAEQSRLEYLEEQLERKYKEQLQLQDKILELED